MADNERSEATEFADTLHRHGDPDPSQWEKAEAVTGRPNDTPLRGEDEFAVPNTTLADRAKSRKQGSKRVVESENKAVTAADTKQPAKRAAAKKAK